MSRGRAGIGPGLALIAGLALALLGAALLRRLGPPTASDVAYSARLALDRGDPAAAARLVSPLLERGPGDPEVAELAAAARDRLERSPATADRALAEVLSRRLPARERAARQANPVASPPVPPAPLPSPAQVSSPDGRTASPWSSPAPTPTPEGSLVAGQIAAAESAASHCDFERALELYAALPAAERDRAASRRDAIEAQARRFRAGLERVRGAASDPSRTAAALAELRAVCTLPPGLLELEEEALAAARVHPPPRLATTSPAPPPALPPPPTATPRRAIAAGSPSRPATPLPAPREPGIAAPPTPVPMAAAGPLPGTATPADPGLVRVCRSALGGDFAQAARELDRLDPGELASAAGDALAGVVYFNASYQAVLARRCDEGRELAARAAAHDDPWRVPSNFGWRRTLEQVRNCQDFNLATLVQVLRPKPLPDGLCGGRSSAPGGLAGGR